MFKKKMFTSSFFYEQFSFLKIEKDYYAYQIDVFHRKYYLYFT